LRLIERYTMLLQIQATLALVPFDSNIIHIYIVRITGCNVNPSTPRHKCRSLLRVDSEPRFPSLPSKAGLSVVERVNILLTEGRIEINP
jgi:hypothetical protein